MFTLPETKFYTWKKYQCAYTEYSSDDESQSLPLVLIHPIGVGLSGIFWHRFLKAITDCDGSYKVYNPDLLGCGESDLPRIAYDPKDWAMQLNFFLENVVKKPCILVVQGASFPISVYMAAGDLKCDLIKGLILSGPPAWNIMTNGGNLKISEIVWNLFFDSFVGSLFYKYAQRRKFIESFSVKQLFASPDDVDDEWLSMLEKGAVNPKNRFAVFSFLAGFWRKNYLKLLQKLDQKILLLMGDTASSVSKDGFKESPDQRIELYSKNIANLEGKKIKGRNVLPYESTEEFLNEVRLFVDNFSV
ncbi:alpha/beta hydrolase [Cyanobacterium stanieri LEGE 03274]|uniref:Alpha/beta hydrolase n=1 Tax=Cyanobacterium stanieri LEGE 03274 TaxID=1828756 RepID=A0ABR9V4X2_9CHRO|nr:alpha/beta fold hydrolase [Cyanobacterium stanieri]MBE9222935.1 alpha/beta hydrolase [Cyanobacterium stanieri LEGE 03274]